MHARLATLSAELNPTPKEVFWFYEYISDFKLMVPLPQSLQDWNEGMQCAQLLLVSLLVENSFIVYWYSKSYDVYCMNATQKTLDAERKKKAKPFLRKYYSWFFGNIGTAIFSVDNSQ